MRISKTVSVAANSTSANVLAGELAEFLRVNSAVTVYIVAAAVGIFATMLVGRETILDDQAVSGANRFPEVDKDKVAEHGGYAGEKMTLRLRNSTAGAINVTYVIDIEELG